MVDLWGGHRDAGRNQGWERDTVVTAFSTSKGMAAIAPVGGSLDRILRVETAFSFGFMKPFPMLPFRSSPRAHGHTGTGGSFGFADPDRGSAMRT